jgi:vitamin-K-epoxide reductase (warfarin-sensitive)
MLAAMSARNLLSLIAALALAGVAVSSVSLYHHYGAGGSSFCNFGPNFNCDAVNRSIYSTVDGIPVALIGVLGYLFLLALVVFSRGESGRWVWLLATSFGGLAFALYLTYIEKFVLGVWCALCLASLALIVTISGCASALAVITRRQKIIKNG